MIYKNLTGGIKVILKYLESLYRLQELQKQEEKCREELSRATGEKSLKLAKDYIDKFSSENLRIKKENLTIKNRISKLVGKSEAYHVKIRHLDKMIYGGEVTNIKELAILQERVNTLKSKVEKIDNKAIELMVKAETLKNKIGLEEQKVHKIKLKYHNMQLKSINKIDSIKKKQELTRVEIQQLIKTIPKDYLNKYHKIKKHKKDPIACIENGRCSGCKMMISNLLIEKVHRYNEVICCENCGRILI